MINEKDKLQLKEKGISEEQLNRQLQFFKLGFPFLKLYAAATLGKGIYYPSTANVNIYRRKWDSYRRTHRVVKMVPASGAASRMFKNLYAFLEGPSNYPQTKFELAFFNGVMSFAFSDDLNAVCKNLYGKDLRRLVIEAEYKKIVSALLLPEGLNYGGLPKGLLKFHSYPDGARTPVEEHLAEGALYAKNGDGKAYVHFTVSHDHLPLFKALLNEKQESLSNKFETEFEVTFSEQKPSTDTVAVTPEGDLFRTDDGKILFRPGGHGSLLENLNDLDADVVFLKNIDNVVPDALKKEITEEKEILAGLLVTVQEEIFGYLKKLDAGNVSHEDLLEMKKYIEERLWCHLPEDTQLSDEDLKAYVRRKLNRPVRVCGMVRNDGEPGGGPFLAYSADGTYQLQILESAQIDKSDPEAERMLDESTHFNPVDLVCGMKDYQGNRFDLRRFVDEQTGFISSKSKDGRELRALEHPGLWNGSMSDWNTIFVEVPPSTFNPVKTVNDLLRPAHQS